MEISTAEFYIQAPGSRRTADDYWQCAKLLSNIDLEYSKIHQRIGNDMVLLESMIIADALEFGNR